MNIRSLPDLRTLLAISLLVLAAPMPVKSDSQLDNQRQVELDKAYEQVLYYYFQGDFFNGLTLFSILQTEFPAQLKELSNPGVDPELLKGGMSLAHGIESQAADIFSRILSTTSDERIQTQAWFLLGKAQYQKQQFQQAAIALENINASMAEDYLDSVSRDELVYLQSQLFSWLPEPAVQQIDWETQLSEESVYRDYVVYNQSLAALKKGDVNNAIKGFSDIGHKSQGWISSWFGSWMSPFQQADDEELLALRDRANLTLGYSLLQQDDADQAIEAFNRVRLDSQDTQAAMLGYGWAASHQQDYQLAVSVWEQLLAQSRSSEYVLEAYLASGYAFEQLSAPRQALAQLQLGLERFSTEINALQRSKTQINDKFFVELAASETEGNQSTGHFANLLLAEDVRVQLAQLKELLDTNHQFDQWQARLETYHLMLQERQQEAGKRAEQLRQSEILSRLEILKEKRDALAATLVASKKQNMGLLNQQESAWLSRLSGAKERLERIRSGRSDTGQKPISSRYLKRLKRIEGVMLWNASESFSQRRWDAQKVLNNLDNALQDTQAQQARLMKRLGSAPDYSQQRQRVDAITLRLTEQQAKADNLVTGQLTALRSLFEEKIDQQIALLKNYQLQAQLAIVRLNDEAYRNAQATLGQGDLSNGK